MNLLPYTRKELTSSLEREVFLSRIKSQLEPTEIFGISFSKKSTKNYEGFINGNHFKFRRILKSGRNSFIPIVDGVIENNVNGCILHITIKFHRLLYILLSAFLVFQIILLLTAPSFTGLFILIATYIIPVIVFNNELRAVVSNLNTLLSK